MPARPTGARGPSWWLATPRKAKGGLPDSHGRTEEWLWLLTPTKADNMLSPSMKKWAGWRGRGLEGSGDPLSILSRALGLPGRNLLAAIYEHIMGFPPGWLSAAAKPTETPSSPS